MATSVQMHELLLCDQHHQVEDSCSPKLTRPQALRDSDAGHYPCLGDTGSSPRPQLYKQEILPIVEMNLKRWKKTKALFMLGK